MNALTIFKGRKGKNATNGIDGLNSTDVDSNKLENPILDSLQPNTLSKNAFVEWARNSISSYIDRYNNNRQSTTSEATNLVLLSEDFSAWDDVLSQFTIIGSTTDPFGGNNATEIELDADTRNPAGTIPVMGEVIFGLTTGISMVASFHIKLISGVIDNVEYSEDSNFFNVGVITTDWKRVAVRIGNNSASSRFGVSPRGDSGARFALFGVQFEDDLLTDYIKTTGTARTDETIEDIPRQGIDGYLIEGLKQNLCHNTNDFANWSVNDGSVISFAAKDFFNYDSALSRIVWASLPTVILSTTTETLTPITVYTVSFWAFITGGSLTSITVSLGDGTEVTLPQPSVLDFERLSVKVTAGTGNTLTLKATSDNLTAQLHCQGFQIETGELSSYSASGSIGQTRPLDLVSMLYTYNAPLPSGNWSFVFGKELPDDNDVKTIFSNGESTTNEFSLSYQNKLLTFNNGGNTTSIDLFDFKKVAVTYDGTDVRFYGEQTLIDTITLGSTSFIAANMFIGSDGTGNAANGSLSNVLFYNETLSDNDVIYLLGV